MRKYKHREAEDGGPKIKASWENCIVHIFCDLCIREIEIGNRPGTHLNKNGWRNLLDNFARETGRAYDRHQMKNKWDQLKKDWKLWKQILQNETSVKWDPKRNTIDAPNIWWLDKLKDFPEARKFRSHGIEPALEEKLDKMFMLTMDIEDYNLAPFSTEDTDPDETPQKKRIIEQDASPEKETQTLILGLAAKQSAESPIRKVPSQTDPVRDGIESRSTATSVRKMESGCTITDAIHLLDSIEEIPKATPLYYFATKLILDRDKREVFMALAPDIKVWWLKMEEQESKK